MTPPGPTVVLARTVLAAFLVGLVVTVVSAIIPAIRASRTSPVAAINDTRNESQLPQVQRALAGLLVTRSASSCSSSASASTTPTSCAGSR